MKGSKNVRYLSAEDAVKMVKSHDRIALSNFCAEPHILPDKIMDRAGELEGVKIFHCTPFGNFQEKYLIPGMEKHIRCVTPFCGRKRGPRTLIGKGKADFVPATLGSMPAFLKNEYDANVFMAQVTPPDENGYVSLGLSVDFALALLEKPVEKFIVEINPRMPRSNGDSLVHISRIDAAVEVDLPLFEFPQKPPTDTEKLIGKNVASLVDDGATIQIGFGNVSEATAVYLRDKKNLGIHSEMIPDGIVDLVEQGVVNGKNKSIDQGKITCTFIGGTQKIYNWMNCNNILSMQRAEYVNNPLVIAKNKQMTAINSALQVDLFGNIYSDIFGLTDQYTGSGGQLDFATGCVLAPDSKFIVAMPSTAMGNTVSKIVAHPSLEDNPNIPMIATVPRYYADYIVTEYGVAALKRKGNVDRAKALITISHPDFRQDLENKAKSIGLLP